MQHFDAIIIGAGAAGLFCAGVAAQRGVRLLLVDHSAKLAEKIRISGGGRCNFTNRELDAAAPQRHFISQNPQFCRSALARYTPADFTQLVQRHGIAFHEKHKGQLFCDRSAEDIIDMLVAECAGGASGGSVVRWQPCSVKSVVFSASSAYSTGAISYHIDTDYGGASAPQLVIATGGLSIPKIGATDFGYRLASQFSLKRVAERPGLVPLTFDGDAWAPYASLAGLALPVTVGVEAAADAAAVEAEAGTIEKKKKSRKPLPATSFHEDLLFTHRGLSGPAILQISSYWNEGARLNINFAPGTDMPEALQRIKISSRRKLANELATLVPTRLADAWTADDPLLQRTPADIPDRALDSLAQRIAAWRVVPSGSEGYRKAEVTIGGIDTAELSQQTMEAKRQPGLFCIGEVVDVTGWLGGYNFQWAWASGHACGQALQRFDPA